MAKPIHTVCEEHNYPLDVNGECFFCAEEQENKLKAALRGKAFMTDSNYFMYCLKCEQRVDKDSCSKCGSMNYVVDWPEPTEDCTEIINGKDCLERSEDIPCQNCQDWERWNSIRLQEV